MARKPESGLQLSIRKALEREFPDSYWLKIHGNEFQSGGIGDLLGCVEGLFFMLEVKRPGKDYEEPTLLQVEHIKLVKVARGVSGVVTSSEQAIELVRNSLARAASSAGIRLFQTRVRSIL